MCVCSQFGSRARLGGPERGGAWARHGAPAGGAERAWTTGLRAMRSTSSTASPRRRRRGGAAERSSWASAQAGEPARRSALRRRTYRGWEERLAALRPAGARAPSCGSSTACTQVQDALACGSKARCAATSAPRRAADGRRQTLRLVAGWPSLTSAPASAKGPMQRARRAALVVRLNVSPFEARPLCGGLAWRRCRPGYPVSAAAPSLGLWYMLGGDAFGLQRKEGAFCAAARPAFWHWSGHHLQRRLALAC